MAKLANETVPIPFTPLDPVFLRRSMALAAFLDYCGHMPIYPHDERTYQIIGAAMEVHRILHRGLKEELYCHASAIEFELRNIPYARAVPCRVVYKDRQLGGCYFIDFVCFDDVVVEVKATSALTPADEAQILNYLALLKKRVGLLINFGGKSLQYKRFVLDIEREEKKIGV